jgi:hypothetical protein
MTIISLDPGLTSGFAIRFDNGSWGTAAIPRSMMEVVSKIDEYKPTILIIETFIGIAYNSKYGIETMELIGAVKYWCLLNNCELVRRTNVQRKPLMPAAIVLLQERRKLLGKRYVDHETDALAHLLSWERDVERGRARAHSNLERDTV